jgi:hypothetical protein
MRDIGSRKRTCKKQLNLPDAIMRKTLQTLDKIRKMQ